MTGIYGYETRAEEESRKKKEKMEARENERQYKQYKKDIAEIAYSHENDCKCKYCRQEHLMSTAVNPAGCTPFILLFITVGSIILYLL